MDCLVIFVPLNTDFLKMYVIYMRLFSSQYFREGQSGESSYTKKASVQQARIHVKLGHLQKAI